MNKYILEARNVKKSFATPNGSISVLNGIDLAVQAGESLSIRGESGAGKTTLLYLLTLLERPESGSILWQGADVTHRGNATLANLRGKLIGLVFQSYYLVPELTALENVLLARRIVGSVRKEDNERALDLLKRVGLAHRLDHVPGKLSGGESQRVAIARALMNQPPVIVADEPTGNLDEHTGESVMALLINLCLDEKISLILVTHNPAFALRTNRQLFIKEGKLVE